MQKVAGQILDLVFFEPFVAGSKAYQVMLEESKHRLFITDEEHEANVDDPKAAAAARRAALKQLNAAITARTANSACKGGGGGGEGKTAEQKTAGGGGGGGVGVGGQTWHAGGEGKEAVGYFAPAAREGKFQSEWHAYHSDDDGAAGGYHSDDDGPGSALSSPVAKAKKK